LISAAAVHGDFRTSRQARNRPTSRKRFGELSGNRAKNALTIRIFLEFPTFVTDDMACKTIPTASKHTGQRDSLRNIYFHLIIPGRGRNDCLMGTPKVT
jgi:hypothetical protein